MSERNGSAGRKRRPTAAEISAGRANLAAGRAKQAEKRAEGKAEGHLKRKERWAMLLSGTITVRDLDDGEIAAMRVRGADGSLSGRAKPVPSHLAQQFKQEAIRRAKDRIQLAVPEVTKELLSIARDPDTKDSDRIKVLMYLMDRQLGKTPDVVRFDGESDFDGMLRKAVGLDRDMADPATPSE